MMEKVLQSTFQLTCLNSQLMSTIRPSSGGGGPSAASDSEVASAPNLVPIVLAALQRGRQQANLGRVLMRGVVQTLILRDYSGRLSGVDEHGYTLLGQAARLSLRHLAAFLVHTLHADPAEPTMLLHGVRRSALADRRKTAQKRRFP